MYGILMPVLFPIALFAFVNLYANERLLMAYYYQQPPQYDDELIRSSLKIMKKAPIFMFVMAYFALGNG